MARVFCINDYVEYARMVALLLQAKGGHEVRAEIVPFELKALEAFNPDVVVLNIVRKVEALGEPLADFFREVDGARALRTVMQNRLQERYPLVVTSIAVLEDEMPPGLDYLAFIELPAKLDNLLLAVDQVVGAKAGQIARE